jgi:hypothetical protein
MSGAPKIPRIGDIVVVGRHKKADASGPRGAIPVPGIVMGVKEANNPETDIKILVFSTKTKHEEEKGTEIRPYSSTVAENFWSWPDQVEPPKWEG